MAIYSTPNQNAVQKQLDATLSAAATTATLSDDVSSLFPDTSATHPCVAVIDRIDSNGNLTPTKREYVTFTGVSTTDLTGLTRNADGSGTDQEHAVGAIVEFVPDVLWAKSLKDNYAAEEWTSNTDGATITFNLALTRKHRVTITDNRTLALSNVMSGHVFIIKITQDGSGSHTVTWFDTITWADGLTPTLTTTASKSDVFGFMQTGTDTYDGFILGQNL